MKMAESLLREVPLFADLEADTQSRLLEVARERRFRPGEVLSPAGVERGELFVLIRGEVAITRGDRLVGLARAPAVLGVSDVLPRVGGARGGARPPPDEGYVAFSHVDTVVLPGPAFDQLLDLSTVLDRNVIEWLQKELRAQEQTNTELLRHFEDFFAAPNARLVSGPYVTEPYPMVLFVMEDDPARLARLLPKDVSLVPGMGGRYLISFNFFNKVRSKNPSAAGRAFSYHETTPFIPCVAGGRAPGLFSPEMYPDNYLAITLGREMYGFPKRFAKTERVDGEDGSHIDVVMDGRLVLRASWADDQALPADTFVQELASAFSPDRAMPDSLSRAAGHALQWIHGGAMEPVMPVFVHKQIPDCESEAEMVFEIDELVEIPFRVTSADRFVALRDPDVRIFGDSWFLGGVCRAAFQLQLGFTFGRARERLDYRIGRGIRERLWRRVRRALTR